MADVEQNPLTTRDFSRVVLTLDNVLVPDDKISNTPSTADGLDTDSEYDLRVLGCELIQTAGILLKLPQIVAMSCINLASKIEESPRRIRDVINVFHHIKQVRSKKDITPMPVDGRYLRQKEQVIKSERKVLKELGFCVHVKHPHKTIITYLQVLDQQYNNKLVQCAWNYMNDSFRTDVFCRFPPETISSACIWLAARQLNVPLPGNPAWYSVFRVEQHEIEEIALTILRLYARQKPEWERLEKTLNEIKQRHQEEKLKRQGLSSTDLISLTHSNPGTPSKSESSPSVQHISSGRANKENREHRERHSNNHHHEDRHRHDRGHRKKRTRSRSKSVTSHSSGRSGSRSPPSNKRKRRPPSPIRAPRSSNKDKYSSHRGERNHSRAFRSRSRSVSRSPDRKLAKKYRRDKVNSKHRSRSRSRSHGHYDKGFDARSYIKQTKKSNGHHRDRSRSRDRYRR